MCIYELQLLITTCYLQISGHDFNPKLTLGIHFDKWSWSILLLTWILLLTFSENVFWSVNMLVFFHLMEIFPKTRNFWNKKIVKHCLTIIKYFETTTNTKSSTANHYLTNFYTKNWLWKEGIFISIILEVLLSVEIFASFSHQL